MCVCVCHLSKEGGVEYSSDKLPHLGRFRKGEKSCGEAFISEMGGKKRRWNQDGVNVRRDEKMRDGEEKLEKVYDKEWKRKSKRMFSLGMLTPTKRGHQYVVPPIGTQDFE